MDSFIYQGDLVRAIQSDNLNQIIGGNLSILDSSIRLAIDEVKSFVRGKYDIEKGLTPIKQHDKAGQYKAGTTVYLHSGTYMPTKTYALGDTALQGGKVYYCSTSITIGEVFNPNHWTLLGNQWDLFYSIFPNPEFDYTNVYAIGDMIFYKDKTYTAIQPTQILDHQASINLGVQINSNIINVFPDDPIKGLLYWGVGTEYIVPIGTYVTDDTYWTAGDNRDQKLLQVCIDVMLYHLHSRIAPKNIPDFRRFRYMGEPEDRIICKNTQRVLYPIYSALGWLQSVTIGNDVSPKMPQNQPQTGGRILRGGNVKLQNGY